MPICFQLMRKDDGLPATFQTIDNELCQNLDLPWDTKRYTYEWYDIIGFKLAMGKSFQEITNELGEISAKYPADADFYRQLIRINHYLLEHYDSDSWREWGRSH